MARWRAVGRVVKALHARGKVAATGSPYLRLIAGEASGFVPIDGAHRIHAFRELNRVEVDSPKNGRTTCVCRTENRAKVTAR